MANYRKTVRVRILTAAEKKVRWTPVRTGAIYCSPGCGGKCKHADFEQATRNAAILARAMNEAGYGNRWVPRVWENLGWHWSVEVRGNMEFRIHPRDKGDPLGPCWVSFIPRGAAQIVAEADSPMRAVSAVGDQVRAIYDTYTRALKTVNQFRDGGRKRR